MIAPIFKDEGLFDERPCESGRHSTNAEYLAGKPLIVGRLAGREASENLSLSKASCHRISYSESSDPQYHVNPGCIPKIIARSRARAFLTKGITDPTGRRA